MPILFNEIIRDYRQLVGMSQEAFGEAIGVSRVMIGKYESGRDVKNYSGVIHRINEHFPDFREWQLSQTGVASHKPGRINEPKLEYKNKMEVRGDYGFYMQEGRAHRLNLITHEICIDIKGVWVDKSTQ